jgi:hypothetical protein
VCGSQDRDPRKIGRSRPFLVTLQEKAIFFLFLFFSFLFLFFFFSFLFFSFSFPFLFLFFSFSFPFLFFFSFPFLFFFVLFFFSLFLFPFCLELTLQTILIFFLHKINYMKKLSSVASILQVFGTL